MVIPTGWGKILYAIHYFSGLLNSITYLNSVDTYFNYYVSTLSGQINSINNNLYSITSDNITVNSLNSNLFYSTRGQIDILTNSTIARMSDVYSDNIYK